MSNATVLRELKEIRKGQMNLKRMAESDLRNPLRVDKEIEGYELQIANLQVHIARLLATQKDGHQIIERADKRIDVLNQQIKLLQNQVKIERLLELQARVKELKLDSLASAEAQLVGDDE